MRQAGPHREVAGLLFVTVLALSFVGSGTAVDPASVSNETVIVQQDDACYEVAPLGNGSKTVDSFYNYSTDYDYGSAGTAQLQANQVSNLFAYHGKEGISLVFLHDKHGEAPFGGTVTFTVTGLPEDGQWVVEDDTYEGRDDNFQHDGSVSEIDWMWASNRTDGAAFRGLASKGNTTITIDPAFNEHANAWGEWPYSGDSTNRTDEWRLLGENGTEITELSMSTNVTVATGTCTHESSASVSR